MYFSTHFYTSNLSTLLLHINTDIYVQIHLCCGNQSLGSTEISLAALLKNSVDLVKQVAAVEGAFVLKPPNCSQQNRQSVPVDFQPTVGVAVTLREEADAEVYKEPKSMFQ